MPSPATLLRHALRILVPLAVVSTTYLYLYPVFLGCAFPVADPTDPARSADALAAFVETARQQWPEAVELAFPRKPSPPSKTAAADGVFDDDDVAAVSSRPSPAPFRLLALGDPQLEGDTSIAVASRAAAFPHWSHLTRRMGLPSSSSAADVVDDAYKPGSGLLEKVRLTLHDVVDVLLDDLPAVVGSLRKRLDLFGNDFYLAHVYRTLRWWARPTHVAVLGDLLGSQWLDDGEFARRADRFWGRVVAGAQRVPDDVAAYPADEYDLAGFLGKIPLPDSEASRDGEPGLVKTSEADLLVQSEWAGRVINVAGNHDVGYAGDMTEDRLARFERAFGKANYELRFEVPLSSPEAVATLHDGEANPTSDRLPPELRVVVVNDMNLDAPALDSALQDATYGFVNAVIGTASAVEFRGHFTLVLTHIPLYKPEGVCVDGPFFAYHDSSAGGGGVREQNQLTAETSKGFLEGIFGLSGDSMAPGNGRGRRGVILNGHDHEGCDTFHYVNQSEGSDPTPEQRPWRVVRWGEAKGSNGGEVGEQQQPGFVGAPGIQGLREITVRSMMGEFGGNAGLLSAWFDEREWEWRFEYAECRLGKQHLWWAVHVVDVLAVLGCVLYSLMWVVGATKEKKADAVEGDDGLRKTVDRATRPELAMPKSPLSDSQETKVEADDGVLVEKYDGQDEDEQPDEEEEYEYEAEYDQERSTRESTMESVSRRSKRESTVESSQYDRSTPVPAKQHRGSRTSPMWIS